MIEIGFGEKYDNASYEKEQNVLHRQSSLLRASDCLRSLRLQRVKVLKAFYSRILSRCVRC